MKKYAICLNRGKISVKRTDRDNDFGEVLARRDTLNDARLCAKVERMVLARWQLKYAPPAFLTLSDKKG